jgi:dihydroxyacetone kinase
MNSSKRNSKTYLHTITMSSSSSSHKKAKKLLNHPDDVVTEMLEGLVAANGRVRKLVGHDVIVRSDLEQMRGKEVSVISGGGSGHEPAFAGYVGQGGLAAAVVGGVFSSPPAAAVLAAIQMTCEAKKDAPGCLVLVMNYTGDRLNFGLAVEKARRQGYKVELLIVADDCALPKGKGITGRRGVAGTILVSKVACAAARAGLSLAAVMRESQAAAECVGSLGIALTNCTLPGQVPCVRIGQGKMEVGLGIHGEPGMEQTPLLAADDAVDRMLSAITGAPNFYLPTKRGDRVVLLINNLGATPLMEILIVARRCVHVLMDEMGVVVERVYAGHFMTSLDMAGCSLSIMHVDDQRLARLDATCAVAAWNAAELACSPRALPLLDFASEKEGFSSDSSRVIQMEPSLMKKVTKAAADALLLAEPDLTHWDQVAGDGDCGITFARGATAVLKALDECTLPLDCLVQYLHELASIMGAAMGGTSGALLEIFFTAGAAILKEEEQPSHQVWAGVVGAGTKAIEYYGGATVGMRTLLDALVPLAAALSDGKSLGDTIAAGVSGAKSTQGMDAQAGRANYVSRASQVPDPGAMAVAVVLEAIYSVLQRP